ncbi:MAG: transcription antitermination factor NusB [Treponema sp.]|jgi:N utilization substance protein B|nr:transcription antitermination factor NusB [Treponema sp.]
MASRRKGRILAFQALYAWDLSGKKPDDQELPEFSRLLIAGTVENISAIDKMIRKHLQNWDISRLNRVDLAVLRISVYALMYQPDTAPSIVIDEAIGISKEFGTDDSYRFVNGVLDGIRKSLEAEN